MTDEQPLDSPWIQRVSLIARGQWTDPEGRRWVMRGAGGTIPAKRVRQLLLQKPPVRVKLSDAADWEFVDVAPADREVLWERMHPHLTGRADRAGGDHTEFGVGEFRDETGDRLLVIEEHC